MDRETNYYNVMSNSIPIIVPRRNDRDVYKYKFKQPSIYQTITVK